jgi:hypothetical protein
MYMCVCVCACVRACVQSFPTLSLCSPAQHVRFQVLTAASMKFRFVFWDILPCKITVDRRFRSTCCLHHQGDEACSTSQKTNLNRYTVLTENISVYFVLQQVFVLYLFIYLFSMFHALISERDCTVLLRRLNQQLAFSPLVHSTHRGSAVLPCKVLDRRQA